MDLFIHLLRGKDLLESCEISLALQVHGGVNYAEDSSPGGKPDGRWWFGFDCGHAGDYFPYKDETARRFMDEMFDSMAKEARGIMGGIVFGRERIYRDQQYVVSECQSLAAQLLAVVHVIESTKARGDQQ